MKKTSGHSNIANQPPTKTVGGPPSLANRIGRNLLLLIPAIIIGLNVALLIERLEDKDGTTSLASLESAEAEIVHLDEILTMSARMYAATGEAVWKERYLDHVDKLDNYIAKARHLSNELLQEDLVTNTDQANRILVDIENRSFELVEIGNRSEASTILQSPEYMEAKADFVQGMDGLWQNLRLLTIEKDKWLYAVACTHAAVSIVGLVILIYLIRKGIWKSASPAQVSNADTSPPKIMDWRSTAWALAALVFFLLLTNVAVTRKRQAIESEKRSTFNRLADHAISEISRRILVPIYGLNGARGTFAASESVNRHEFKAFVESRDSRNEFAGAIAFGYVARVNRDDLEQFVAQERADDAPDFSVKNLGAEDTHYIAKFVEPLGSNSADFGVDFGADPIQRVAIETAIRQAQPIVTAPMTIAQGLRSCRAVRYFVPVYNTVTPPTDEQNRIDSLQGLLFATVSTEELLTGISSAAQGLIDVDIFDGRQLTREKLLADTGVIGDFNTFPNAESEYKKRKYFRLQVINSLGRDWSVAVTPTTMLSSSMDRATLIEESAAGILISVMFAVFIFLQRTGKNRAIAMAREMVTELSDAKNHAEINLREIEALRSTMDLASLVSVTDPMGTIIEANDKFCQVSGYSRDELIGENHRIINSGVHPPEFWQHLWNEITAGRPWHGEICNRRKDGNLYWVESTIAPFRGEDGKIQKIVAIRNDITERKEAEEQLRLSAQTDKLTAMPNRAMFNHRLDATVRRSQHDPNYHFAVLFIDFDRFKLINDSFGHETGDLLLQQIAARLNSVLRPSDAMILGNRNLAARFGGDEFVILLDHLTSPEDATIVADRLLAVLKEPYDLHGNLVYSSASIGIVTSAIASGNSEAILRDADVAMYEAKAAGRACYVVFDKSMLKRIRDRHDLENNLRGAINDGGIHLNYQPIVEVASGQITSFEALVRWQHSEFGLIPPDQFITMAEDNGLIVPLGWYVLEQACHTLVRFQSLPGGQNLAMNVNVSRRQLMEPGFIPALQSLIENLELSPESLRLEITESLVMAAEDSIVESLGIMKAMGVQIYMDDFGTGLSSLGLLRRLPLDGIKVDRCFIEAANGDRESIAILQAIVSLGHNLGMSVTAEGIENPEQVATILALECDLVQGYLFGRPVPIEDAEKLLGKTWHEITPRFREQLSPANT